MIVENCDIGKIYESCQSYNMEKLDDIRYLVKTGKNHVECIQLADDLLVRCEHREERFWKDFFDEGYDYINFWEKGISDKNRMISEAFEMAEGLRLIHSDLFETVVKVLLDRDCKFSNNMFYMFGRVYGRRSEWYGFPDSNDLYYCGLNSLKVSNRYYPDVLEEKYSDVSNRIFKVCNYFSNTMGMIGIESFKGIEEQRNFLMREFSLSGVESDIVMLYSGRNRNMFPVVEWVKNINTLLGESEIQRLVNKFSGETGMLWLILDYYVRVVLKN